MYPADVLSTREVEERNACLREQFPQLENTKRDTITFFYPTNYHIQVLLNTIPFVCNYLLVLWPTKANLLDLQANDWSKVYSNGQPETLVYRVQSTL